MPNVDTDHLILSEGETIYLVGGDVYHRPLAFVRDSLGSWYLRKYNKDGGEDVSLWLSQDEIRALLQMTLPLEAANEAL